MITLTHTANNCAAIKDPIRAFFVVSLTQIFYVTEYSPYISVVGKIGNVLVTFIWSYTDLFVMLISIGLASRFKLINDFIQKHKGKVMLEEFWAKQRRNYTDLCGLLDRVDDHIGQITMLSFANNLFFICTQLMNSMK
jgi:gustatory receptor